MPIARVSIYMSPEHSVLRACSYAAGFIGLVSVIAGCSTPERTIESPLRPVWLFAVTPATATLGIGDTVQLRAVISDRAAVLRGDTLVRWQSTHPDVADLADPTGRVVARSIGQTMVLATLLADSSFRAGALITVTSIIK
jgi:hypothetical protein